MTFHQQQRIDYYCKLNNFVSPKLELCRKALVNISNESSLIYIVSDYHIKYAHNDLISDFSIFGIQIGIFADMIYKFITCETTRKFWKHHIIFFIISIEFVSHQVHKYVWGFPMLLLIRLSQWLAIGGCLIGASMPACNQTKKMSNHQNQNSFASQKLQLFSKAMKPKASFAHYITMAPLTDSMPEFFPEVPLPTKLNQAKKMSNHYNWNCFASQKL